MKGSQGWREARYGATFPPLGSALPPRAWPQGQQVFCSDHPVLCPWRNDENRGQEANPAHRYGLLLFFNLHNALQF